MKKVVKTSLCWVSPLLLMTTVANAQVLEEIVVTAQKREQSAQDLPMSVTAFSGDTARQLGIQNSEDLVQHTVNFNVTSAMGEGTRPAYFMRGVGLNDFNTNNAGPVGVYLDEVYLSSIASQMVPVFDVDRIEVLRGPQGTLFGRNTSAGALSFYSKEPSDEFEGFVKARYGSHGSTGLEAAASGSLGRDLRGRLALVRQMSDGFIENRAGDRQEGARNVFAWRGQLAADPTNNLELLLNVHGGRDQSQGAGYQHLGILDPNSQALCEAKAIAAGRCTDAVGYRDETGDFYAGAYDFGKDTDSDTLGGVFKINWYPGAMTITAITGYDEVDQSYYEDADAGPLPVLHVSYGVEAETFSQELRALGATDNSNWIVGAYFMTEDLEQNQTADILRVLRPQLGFDPANSVLFSRHQTEQKTDSYALFGQLEYALTDRLRATTGIRWTREERDFLYSAALEEPTFSVPLFAQRDAIKDDDVSGRLGLDYDLSDAVRVYANVSKGFKAGGFNGGFLFESTPVISYEPETLISWETGVKSEYLQGRARLNVAAFYYDYSNLQVFSFINTGAVPTQVLTNASDAEIYGLEAELDLLLTTRLGLRLGLGLLETELQDYQSAAGADFSGNELPQAPGYSVNGLAYYDLPLATGATVTFQADFSYQDDVFFLNDNNPVLSQDAYGLLNARLSYLSADESIEFSLWGKNLSDEEYLVGAFDLSDFGLYQQMRGSEASFGAELLFSF